MDAASQHLQHLRHGGSLGVGWRQAGPPPLNDVWSPGARLAAGESRAGRRQLGLSSREGQRGSGAVARFLSHYREAIRQSTQLRAPCSSTAPRLLIARESSPAAEYARRRMAALAGLSLYGAWWTGRRGRWRPAKPPAVVALRDRHHHSVPSPRPLAVRDPPTTRSASPRRPQHQPLPASNSTTSARIASTLTLSHGYNYTVCNVQK
jgi:hypothetical protein